MNKKILGAGGVIILVLVGVLWWLNATAPATTGEVNLPEEITGEVVPINDKVISFDVVGTNFEFSQKEIRVKKGQIVKINFQVAEGFHDFVLDEFGVRTSRYRDTGGETVEFTADKTGVFEYYCSVGEHRSWGMRGNLIVEE